MRLYCREGVCAARTSRQREPSRQIINLSCIFAALQLPANFPLGRQIINEAAKVYGVSHSSRISRIDVVTRGDALEFIKDEARAAARGGAPQANGEDEGEGGDQVMRDVDAADGALGEQGAAGLDVDE